MLEQYLKIRICKILEKNSPSANAKRLEMVWGARQDDFRNFCMSDKTEKVYKKLEEVISL